jgi:hypothetical protein
MQWLFSSLALEKSGKYLCKSFMTSEIGPNKEKEKNLSMHSLDLQEQLRFDLVFVCSWKWPAGTANQ